MSLPSPGRSMPFSEANRGSSPVPFRTPANIEDTRGTRLDNSKESQHSSIPDTQDPRLPKGEPHAHGQLDSDASSKNAVVGNLNLPDSLSPSAEIDSTSRRKMDFTQASTQSNAGRSYDKYCRPLSPGHTSPAEPARSNSPGRRDQNEDDVGVRFDFADVLNTTKIVSPAQNDSGFVNFGNLNHFRHAASQATAQSPTQASPLTPAPPQNPFRNSRSGLLPTSQLFRGTQFSSPIKHASPTSSRPSPADFPGNSISPNLVVSSPLKARGLRSSPTPGLTSSPEILPGTISSKAKNRASSPVDTASAENPVVPESSHDGPSRKRSGPEPMASYEPMDRSQERRSTSVVRTDAVSSGDEDSQNSVVRRRRAKDKKEAALRQLTAISFPRPTKTEDVEVPLTSQRKRTSRAEAYTAQFLGYEPRSNDTEGTEAMTGSQSPLQPFGNHPIVDKDTIQTDVEEEVVPAANPTSSGALELPRSSTESATQAARDACIEAMSHGDAIPETSPTGRVPDPLPALVPSSEPAPSATKSTQNFQSSPPAFSMRSRKGQRRRGYPTVTSSSSSLSNLASTPQLPSSNPLGSSSSAPPGSPTESTIVASSSPAVAQTKRRDVRGRLPKLRTGSAENLRQAAKVTRRGSNSTDELARSLSGTPTFEQSLRVSRASMSRSASRSGRGSMKPPILRDQKLFENMAFAISFQSRKPGESNDQYNSRVNFSTMIQKRIKEAGGRILENGFDELFEALPLGSPSNSPASTPGAEADINLTPEGRTMGFTALIADGHSRKVKYMQALALGLPCVAARWVTTCLERNELVDWAPYLLCAGQSAFLGDAIRSRSLSSYDATTARLTDVIGRRERLLEGSRILAVVKKSLEGRKKAYVFLARVLGATLTRVYSVEQAKAEMKAAEKAGQPFDWVYVDGKPDEEALFSTEPVGGKKRKRAGAAASLATQPPVKRIRTLSDELVIQSLILGRLIEEWEMDS
ncbi:hypothetical protein VTI28DRAFT_3458 [Corynascus sepedonium]